MKCRLLGKLKSADNNCIYTIYEATAVNLWYSKKGMRSFYITWYQRGKFGCVNYSVKAMVSLLATSSFIPIDANCRLLALSSLPKILICKRI